MRYGMVIDLKKCIGCRGCSIACKSENCTPPGMFWNDVVEQEFGTFPNVTKTYLPRPCMHCEEPECVRVCPTGASYKREDGLVLVDSDKCMGCRYCVIACPYQARSYLGKLKGYFGNNYLTPYEKVGYKKFQEGVAYKCTFCVHRIEKGLKPACVANCMGNARYFGDLDDPNSEVSQLLSKHHTFQLMPEKGTKPSVYYIAP